MSLEKSGMTWVIASAAGNKPLAIRRGTLDVLGMPSDLRGQNSPLFRTQQFLRGGDRSSRVSGSFLEHHRNAASHLRGVAGLLRFGQQVLDAPVEPRVLCLETV